MATVLGINAVFHDPAAALVVDGRVVAAAEEERFSRRKHGKEAVPFSTWETPTSSAAWCLQQGGIGPDELDAVAYSYDPGLARPLEGDLTADGWEGLRTLYVREAPGFLKTALPGLDPSLVRFVPHHLAHAASACMAAPHRSSAVMALDGRGETASYLAGHWGDGRLERLAIQHLPHSLGLLYEELTQHLGFKRSSDEYKVMALASYADGDWIEEFRRIVRATPDGGFRVEPVAWSDFAKPRHRLDPVDPEHAKLAATVQLRLEEVLLELSDWLHDQTGAPVLTMAGGVALNCVANSRLAREGPFREIWVQPAAGDAGTALGAALLVANDLGDQPRPMPGADLGRGWTDDEIHGYLSAAAIPFEEPSDIAESAAEILAQNGVVGWFQGRSEYGPRALGQRSLLGHPGHPDNLDRMNDIKGREDFRPIAPMVLEGSAGEIFDGPLPSPFMLFTHQVREPWRSRIPAVVHVDGSSRIQTVDPRAQELTGRLLRAFERRTGLPVLINTSFNTAGRPMVDSPQDALECFGSAPIDALAIGSFLVRRSGVLPA